MDQTDLEYVIELLTTALQDQDWDTVMEAKEFLREYKDDDGGPIELEEWFMWLTILLILFILVLFTVIGFLIKALNVQLRKVQTYTAWIIDLQDKVDNVVQTMHELDDKQMFSKDDDVGSVFQQMVELVDTLNEKTTKE